MADTPTMSGQELVRKVLSDEHADILRDALSWLCAELMEAEVSAQIGAEHGERSLARTTHRNGYRDRRWDTRAGAIELAIPRIRQGSYFPSFLEPRTRAEQALVAVVVEAYVNGVSTRKVERLVEQLGVTGISKSEVSRLCAGLDEQVRALRERPLEARYPYLWLDAKIEKVRDRDGRVRRKALVIAYAVHEQGHREVIDLAVGAAETESFWREFLRGLVARGLTGVELVISDAHPGLKAAIAQVIRCPWQRCTVHFLRDMLGHVARHQQGIVAAAIRPLFRAEDAGQARGLTGAVIAHLEPLAPKVAALLSDAEEDLLAFYAFPPEHHPKLRSTNPLERVNREIGRRSDVVGIFPDERALLRLAGAVLIEQNDEWLVGRRYLSAESMALVLGQAREPAAQPAASSARGWRHERANPVRDGWRYDYGLRGLRGRSAPGAPIGAFALRPAASGPTDCGRRRRRR